MFEHRGFYCLHPKWNRKQTKYMSNKDTSFSIHILGGEMKVINLYPDSFIDLFLWLLAIYAVVKLINLLVKYVENRLNLK